ncbi:MAG: biopolymer transporter ExbD [Acidiferrobacterales bacterium]|nr:biopolymer transporter ExbD [Acidiferrobacterales bacterium]
MFKNRVESQTADEIDITPMLDVVFIMLIFFIVTASFVRESGLAVSKSAGSEEGKPAPTIVLNINEQGEFSIQDRHLDQRAIKATVVRLLAENPEANVSLYVHKRAKTQKIVTAIDELRAANVFYAPISIADI